MTADPRRTAAGNLIDDRLALGIARTFIDQIARGGKASRARLPKGLKCRSQRERKTAFLSLREASGPLFLGMSVKKNLREGVIATLSPHREPDKPYNAIFVLVSGVDLGRPGKRGATHDRFWPYHDISAAAMIDIHALARLIQRTGKREPEEISRVLKRVACWASIARSSEDPGSWMMPVPDGLICAQTTLSALPGVSDWPAPVPIVKTFIDRGALNAHNAGAWERLVSNGALESAPRFPSFDPPDPEHLRIWDLMRDEGRGWDLRRDHAVQGKTSEPDPTEGQDDPEPG